ncbi:steroid monooxygenase [Fusarium coicis]|nr:steroid monooxygenase [Fusarium coicis]
MERGGVKYINPKTEAAYKWKQRVVNLNNATLLPTTKSTYMGGNVPGKASELLAYAAGLPACKNEIIAALDNSTEGYQVVKIRLRLFLLVAMCMLQLIN